MATNGVTKVTGQPGLDVAPGLSILQAFLTAHPKTRFIHYSNMLRTRFTTTARALQIAAVAGAAHETGSPITSADTQLGGILAELIHPGTDNWMPDWSTLRDFAESEGTATVFCCVEEHLSEPRDQEAMTALCARSRLQSAVEKAKASHAVDFLVGTEIEFILVQSPEADKPLHATDGAWTSAACREPHWSDVVEHCVTVLESAGIGVWSFCREGGTSKYEISLSPLPPVEAVDAMHFAHETIKTVAQKRGCHATMHPKAFEKGPTVGKHIHLSLSKPDLGTPFLAAVLKHFRGLCALMLANVDSYQQRNSQFGQGAVSWGRRNKSTTMNRLDDAYFECRVPDSLGNPYLMLAAIIGVGIRGIEDGEELLSKPVTSGGLLEPLTEEQEKEYGVTQHIPATFAEALADMKKDSVIEEALGKPCFDRYIYNKEKDAAAGKKMASADRRKILMANH